MPMVDVPDDLKDDGEWHQRTCPTCGQQAESRVTGLREVAATGDESAAVREWRPPLLCDLCGATGAKPCVREQYVQYEEGGAGFDAPVKIGNLCEECRIEEEADLESDWS